jgi:hypothetical protein
MPFDISFETNLPGILGKAHRRMKLLVNLPSMMGYVVVQFVNPFVFYYSYFISAYFYKIVGNKVIFL